MNPSLRDSLFIAIALLTILGCGFGLGRLTPGGDAPPDPAPVVPTESFAADVEESLQKSLNLNAQQLASIQPEIASLSAEVFDTRQQALVNYYVSLLRFHDRLAPVLDTSQQAKLDQNRKLLEAEFKQRFPSHNAPLPPSP